MTTSLSYADAVKLLRDPGTRFAQVADRLTALGMLGVVAAVPEALGWFDARSEFARFSRELGAV
ncbi:NACHT N-terminal helical domain 7-containing protein [[Actinomadura] parvosata]|uniref:NACHT N-terminal helical domain 7-containing protein n=1 Tax=[Actinomadura] parvosata TaxID=1955412 RepID=UPI00406D2C18